MSCSDYVLNLCSVTSGLPLSYRDVSIATTGNTYDHLESEDTRLADYWFARLAWPKIGVISSPCSSGRRTADGGAAG